MKMQQVYIRDLFCHLQAVEAPSTNDPSTSNAFVAKGWNFSDGAKQQRFFCLFLHVCFVLTSGCETWLFIFHDDSILKGQALFKKKKKRRTRTQGSDIRSLETGTWGSMPSILSEGGTLRPLGMVMLPKSTKKATHQTDNHSEEIEKIRITIFKKCPLEILSWCKRLMDM